MPDNELIPAPETLPAVAVRDSVGRFLPGNPGMKPKGARNRIISFLLGGFAKQLEGQDPEKNVLSYLYQVVYDEEIPHPIRIAAAAALLKHVLPTDFKINFDSEQPRDIKIAVAIVHQQIEKFYGAPAQPEVIDVAS